MMPRSGQESWILAVCNISCIHKFQVITSITNSIFIMTWMARTQSTIKLILDHFLLRSGNCNGTLVSLRGYLKHQYSGSGKVLRTQVWNSLIENRDLDAQSCHSAIINCHSLFFYSLSCLPCCTKSFLFIFIRPFYRIPLNSIKFNRMPLWKRSLTKYPLLCAFLISVRQPEYKWSRQRNSLRRQSNNKPIGGWSDGRQEFRAFYPYSISCSYK